MGYSPWGYKELDTTEVTLACAHGKLSSGMLHGKVKKKGNKGFI